MNDVTALGWLLESDPAIRWQALRDLTDAPDSEWSAERAKVETAGWGARLLALRDDDGQWAGGAFMPADFDRHGTELDAIGQPWTATTWSLSQLREFGLDPRSRAAKETIDLVRANSRWDHDGEPYWDGEVEECINGRTVADGAYFGVDVAPIVATLVSQQMADGGWNCERENGSVRGSFHSTINVLEGLLEFERATGGTPESIRARGRGEEYLLQRELVARESTGDVVDASFLQFHHPNRYRYDILRGLDYFRAARLLDAGEPDARLDRALGIVRSRRDDDGRWPLDATLPGRTWFDIDDGVGRPSRWITLRAMRVLRWVESQ